MNARDAEMNTRRLTGMGAIATLALAVLVFGCVLGATAGPREALNIRTQALRQTLGHIPPLGQTLTASTSWGDLNQSIAAPQASFTDSQLTNLEDQFHNDFSQG